MRPLPRHLPVHPQPGVGVAVVGWDICAYDAIAVDQDGVYDAGAGGVQVVIFSGVDAGQGGVCGGCWTVCLGR